MLHCGSSRRTGPSCRSGRVSRCLLTLLVFAGPLAGSAPAKVETWRQEGPSAFARAHKEGVVISDNGRARLGHSVAPLGTLGAARVWDLARTADGSILAATGDSGQVFRREPRPGAGWSVAYDASDSQVLSLVVCPDGTILAGTGPTGQVVNVSDPRHPASRPDPKVQYIWDLAADSEGNVYAATGPTGQLWKRSREGHWSLVYDSRSTHLLCVAVGPDGQVYAGSDSEGLIYRIARDGKASVLFDAPQSDVRTLLVLPDGTLYAGTAAETGPSPGSRNSLFLSGGDRLRDLDRGSPDMASGGTRASSPSPGATSVAQKTPTPKSPGGPSRPTPGGSASPRPVTPGDNAVYRIDTDGIPREVLRVKALVHSLAHTDNRIWVGTGPEGQLHEIREHGEETAPIARLDSGQVLSLLAEPGGGLLMGTGDPGGVLRLSGEYAKSGELVSEVHDGRLISRFGTLTWRASQPPGSSIAVQTRTGNVSEPDETWSAWSREQTDPTSARVDAPAGRFVQFRVKLTTTDPRVTPELRLVALSYRTANLSPEIARVEVPDLSVADGTVRQTRLNLRWEATDPNDDDLEFRVLVRRDGWPEWIPLNEQPMTEKNHAWDTLAFPSGLYRVKVVASDRPSNNPQDALSRERESLPFLVDHDPPRVRIEAKGREVAVSLADDLTRIVKVEYAVDGGPWTPTFPDDQIFDALKERVELSLPGLAPGIHILLVKATDAAGNIGTGDALMQVKGSDAK